MGEGILSHPFLPITGQRWELSPRVPTCPQAHPSPALPRAALGIAVVFLGWDREQPHPNPAFPSSRGPAAPRHPPEMCRAWSCCPGLCPAPSSRTCSSFRGSSPWGRRAGVIQGRLCSQCPQQGGPTPPGCCGSGSHWGIFGIWIQHTPQGKQVQHSPGSTPQQSSATLRNIFIFHGFFLSKGNLSKTVVV